MPKQRAERNRTITIIDTEKQRLLSKCICEQNDIAIHRLDCVICGDTFSVSKSLQNNSVDLLIVDPPYNLSKVYNENTFVQMTDEQYADFTEKWILSIKHTLKDTASVYVCCDWKSSLIIGRILQKHFYIQNRITWQREKGRGATRNWKNSMEDIWFATVSPTNFTFNVDAVKMRRKVVAPYRVDGKPKDW